MSDEPTAPPTLSLATTEHAASISATNAVKLQLEAQKHRRVADHLQAEGDLVAPHFERAEARRLERVAELALDPVVHATKRSKDGYGSRVRWLKIKNPKGPDDGRANAMTTLLRAAEQGDLAEQVRVLRTHGSHLGARLKAGQ